MLLVLNCRQAFLSSFALFQVKSFLLNRKRWNIFIAHATTRRSRSIVTYAFLMLLDTFVGKIDWVALLNEDCTKIFQACICLQS